MSCEMNTACYSTMLAVTTVFTFSTIFINNKVVQPLENNQVLSNTALEIKFNNFSICLSLFNCFLSRNIIDEVQLMKMMYSSGKTPPPF